MKNNVVWYTNDPPESTPIYGVGEFLRGTYVLVNGEWYTLDEYEDNAYEDTCGYVRSSIEKWTWLPDDDEHTDSIMSEYK